MCARTAVEWILTWTSTTPTMVQYQLLFQANGEQWWQSCLPSKYLYLLPTMLCTFRLLAGLPHLFTLLSMSEISTSTGWNSLILKRRVILFSWHGIKLVSSRFESVSELKLKLMDDYVPSTPSFQVEGRLTQQWIVAREDLDTMSPRMVKSPYGEGRVGGAIYPKS